MVPILQQIAEALAQDQIDFLLVGGFAVNSYGFSRNTKDLDLLVSESQIDLAVATLQRLMFKAFVRSHVVVRMRSAQPAGLDVDLLVVDQTTYLKMSRQARAVEIQGISVRVPKPEHVIAMKLHACKHGGLTREWKDLGDIVWIVKTEGINIQEPAFKELCLHYGSQDLYDKISKAFKHP